MELYPPNYNFLNALRSIGRGWGIAVVYWSHLNFVPFTAGSFDTVEFLTLKIKAKCSNLMNEFSNLLSSTELKLDKLIVVGDFNIHIDDPCNSLFADAVNSLYWCNMFLAPHITAGTPLIFFLHLASH